ncbi:ferritin-like domain-containing protein [Cuneatibacter caecimuris]|uniref:Bacterioferritin n=1 Tax=Cuneatibacter caecimuris TaxID=1796618 RepID=A0A4Q7P0E2_9FIRM|nr:bacterioferritin [Cuneatibacter caecimuris]
MEMNQNHEYQVSADLPYPPIQTQSRNKDYAYAMLSNIGSSNSEMSAVSLYFYNSTVLDPAYSEFSQCFHKISIVEMHHLQIFAALACQMGLDPRLWSLDRGRRSYWSPGYNQYPRMLRPLLENSIKGEQAAIRKYSRQAELICDPDIQAILRRIILDEQLHIEIFTDMLNSIT